MKHLISLAATTLICLSAYCQLAMNEWNMHLAYNATNLIAMSDDNIYALSGEAMFSVDKTDGEIVYYSKLNGLTGATISFIGYDDKTNSLLVVYTNGQIDIIKDGETYSIIDLYNKQLSVASKAPNDIAFKDGRAYLAMQFGIIVLNLEKQEIADTYYIGANGTEVNLASICLTEDSVYAVSETALYRASLQSKNLLDFSNWTISVPSEEIGSLQHITTFNNHLIAATDKGLYQRTGESWQTIPAFAAIEPQPVINRLRVAGNKLFACTSGGLYIFDNEFNITHNSHYAPVYDIIPEGNLYWVAAGGSGVGKIDLDTDQHSSFMPNGPSQNTPYRMRFQGDKLFVVPGGRWALQNNNTGTVMMYQNNQWSNIYTADIMEKTGRDALDFMNVAAFPNDNDHFFVTSFGTGLYEFEGTQLIAHYRQDNSLVTSAAPDDPDHYTRTDGAIFDKHGNLIVVNAGDAEHTIILRTAAGQWKGLNFYLNNRRLVIHTPGEIVIDNRNENYKWIPYARYEPGLVLWDDGGTLDDPSDDMITQRTAFVDQNSNTLIPEGVYCMAQDHDGVIWLGTNLGPITIPASVNFKSSNSCRRILLNRDDGTGLADYLLDGVQINCICIDGGNRKWIGTATSGLYLLSPDGTQTIEHFSTSNSPLISDEILSLAIDNETGEVFIGTAAGLMSYQSDAADPKDNFNDIYAYPNPVREDHEGVITIAGLMENSTVKITDTAGRLVYETNSHGSLATWDGNNTHGNRVPTGVYIVMVSSPDNSKHSTTKILIVNK